MSLWSTELRLEHIWNAKTATLICKKTFMFSLFSCNENEFILEFMYIMYRVYEVSSF